MYNIAWDIVSGSAIKHSVLHFLIRSFSLSFIFVLAEHIMSDVRAKYLACNSEIYGILVTTTFVLPAWNDTIQLLTFTGVVRVVDDAGQNKDPPTLFTRHLIATFAEALSCRFLSNLLSSSATSRFSCTGPHRGLGIPAHVNSALSWLRMFRARDERVHSVFIFWPTANAIFRASVVAGIHIGT
ncbi:uncharacterized protein BJ212DRAFT_1587236 [Suillus subaureus]|uniref:Uncharacterized protein n=1 Tax=Suillus subaureus TaxID=48587 RepID=A0A9P7ED90_9AGAM|nr:uncharacterized protein BJ212DRAFT_1587236 [Suillus subaureus]KAG1817533.1 hypothetical protein BJ212DRAFT_1587236 [Suillus subaureus]